MQAVPAGSRAPRRRLKPAERRRQLLEAAVEVFAVRGLGRGTHADIAEACSVAVGTVFLYFPTREALVAEVLAEVERASMEVVGRCCGSEQAAPEAIRRLVREILDLGVERPAYALIWLDWSTAVRDAIWPRYLAFQQRVVAHIAEAVRRGQVRGSAATRQDPEECARLIMSSTQMLAQMYFLSEPRERIEAFGDRVIDMALGLAATGV